MVNDSDKAQGRRALVESRSGGSDAGGHGELGAVQAHAKRADEHVSGISAERDEAAAGAEGEEDANGGGIELDEEETGVHEPCRGGDCEIRACDSEGVAGGGQDEGAEEGRQGGGRGEGDGAVRAQRGVEVADVDSLLEPTGGGTRADELLEQDD